MKRIAAAMALLLAAALEAPAQTPSVAAGGTHSLALHADGTVRAWGDDSAGALGLGRALVSAAPLPVSGLDGIVAISAGGNHTVALKEDGTVWAWGANDNGELGDGTTTSRSLPVRVAGLQDVVQVSAGRFFTVARTRDGSVWTWGSNNAGELGDAGGSRSTARRIEGFGGIEEIAAGPYHVLARRADGTVWTWGLNGDGQLGDGTRTESYAGRATPVQVAGLANVAQVAAGGWHSLARRSDGTVWAWGANDLGQAGDGTRSAPKLVPVQVALANIVEISAGMFHSAARDGNGAVWTWGGGGYGQLGDDAFEDRLVPIRLNELTGVSQLAAGFLHSAAVRSDGGLYAWGNNDNGQLGNGTALHGARPALLAGVADIASVAVGLYHTVARKRDGTLLTWGDNSQGQLGNGVHTFRSSPQPVAGLPPIAALAAGYLHSLALARDGRVFAWGSNALNQLVTEGIGRALPAPVAGLANVTEVSAGAYHSAARLADGTVRTFGSNYRGRLGNGDPNDFGPLSVVRDLGGVAQVSAGGGHTLAVKADGSVWAWGENDYGQVGDGSTADRYAPVLVRGVDDVAEVAAGVSHSLARTRDGSVWAWGRGVEGQLGGGGTSDRSTPVRVPGLAGASAIAAGREFSFALVGGEVWAWGVNYQGGIGCASCDGRAGPVRIPGLTRIRQLAAFQYHVLALRDDGSVLAWGAGQLGQLGDGTLVDRESPGVVLREGAGGSVAGNDWFLDLDPAIATAIPPENVPVFLVAARPAGADIEANIRFRPQDVGTSASVFVFAVAPAPSVKSLEKAQRVGSAAKAEGDPVPCVLAQLTSSGQLVGVSASNMQAYVSGVLSGQGQAVNLLNGVPVANIAGATFYVGYGASAGAMLDNGINRSAATVPGAVQCKPEPPETGWWWNPAEGGRGYSVEVRGNNIFFAAFHYDVSGRSTWHVATGPTSLDGSLYGNKPLYAASGGQTLGGAYPGRPTVTEVGRITLAFANKRSGTMIWPGGVVPIERFNIVGNGVAAAPKANQPENGWWWNPAEDGRGFFMEWQNGTIDLAGYMYDEQGNSVWYLGVYETPDIRAMAGNWWSYANGQSMMGTYRPATRVSENVAPVTITFTGPDTAIITLPGGRTSALQRHRF